MMRRSFAPLLLLLACTSSAPTPATLTEPVTTLALRAPPGTPLLATELPAAALFGEQAELRIDTRIEALVFATHYPRVHEALPVVLWRDEHDSLHALRLVDDAVQQTGWDDVISLADGALLVGVLDTRIESLGHTLEIVASTDRGHTWRLVHSLQKPSYMASFQSLAMTQGGHGTLTMLLADDEDITGAPPGLYRHWTANYGQDWLGLPRERDTRPDSPGDRDSQRSPFPTIHGERELAAFFGP
jgi:hypothetical protein